MKKLHGLGLITVCCIEERRGAIVILCLQARLAMLKKSPDNLVLRRTIVRVEHERCRAVSSKAHVLHNLPDILVLPESLAGADGRIDIAPVSHVDHDGKNVEKSIVFYSENHFSRIRVGVTAHVSILRSVH